MTTRARSAVGSGSSSDGPRPHDTSSQRRPFSRSPCSTRWRNVSPGGGGGAHTRGAGGFGGRAAVIGCVKSPNGAAQNHVSSGMWTTCGSSNWKRPGKRGMPFALASCGGGCRPCLCPCPCPCKGGRTWGCCGIGGGATPSCTAAPSSGGCSRCCIGGPNRRRVWRVR